MAASRVAAIWCLALLASRADAFYGAGSDVVNLIPDNFDKKLGSGVWLVEFYAPWCGHCKNLKPEWEKAAAALKGIVGVAAVDADAHPALGQRYSVQGFPTVKLMYADKPGGSLKAVDFQGGRTARDIVQWAAQQAQKIALARLGAGSKGGSKGGGSGGGSGFYAGTQVVELTDDDFHAKVIDSDDMWFVEFYAPWCGHCKQLKPTWGELAAALEGKVRVGAVDCTVHKSACAEFGVQGFPTLKFFGAAKPRAEAYEGGRDLDVLNAFAAERWARDQPPPEVRELTDQGQWEEHCLGHDANPSLDLKAVKPKQLCLVAFLPHILDDGAAGRRAHLEMLARVAAVYKDRPFSWFWAQGGEQAALESAVGVGGFGYPALVALNPGKRKFATLRGAFSEPSIKEFMDAVRAGRERVADLGGGEGPPAVETRAPWDGRDAEVAEEEEFSLEDLGIGGAEKEEGEDKDEL